MVPIFHPKLRPQAEEMFDLMQAFPTGGTPTGRAHENVFCRHIFGSKNLGPNRGIVLEKAPNPLKEESYVHVLGIEQSQAPHGLGAANHRPTNKMILTFLSGSFPKEPRTQGVEFGVSPLVQQKEAHHKDRKVVKAGIRQD
jgi:hypothetical protein